MSAAVEGASKRIAPPPYRSKCHSAYLAKRKTWPAEAADQIERQISLSVIDRNWQKHIDTMSHLREGIGLRSYAQTNPLQDYVNEGYDLFKEQNEKAAVDTVFNLLNVRLVKKEPTPEEAAQGPIATMNPGAQAPVPNSEPAKEVASNATPKEETIKKE